MTHPTVFELRDLVTAQNALVIHLARYKLLSALSRGNYGEKCDGAAEAHRYFELAHSIEEHLFRYIQQRPAPVSWFPALHPKRARILIKGELDQDRLQGMIDALVGQLSGALRAILHDLDSGDDFAPWVCLLKTAVSILDCPDDRCVTQYESGPLSGVRKSVSGPRATPLDSSFQPTYSLTQYRSPDFSNDLAETSAYFWTLSIREAMACDSCILSVVEYDGLPLQFYRDLSKQAWDEARHAKMVFDLSKALMREVMRLPEYSNERIWSIIASYMLDGLPLPIPLEGNLYEAMWNASLEERLILMQIQTEGKAVGTLRQRIRSEIAAKNPEIKRVLEIDQRDEVSHTMIGRRWLAYLVPNAQDRTTLIERTDLLRPILISIPISCHRNGGLDAFLNSMMKPSTRPAIAGYF